MNRLNFDFLVNLNFYKKYDCSSLPPITDFKIFEFLFIKRNGDLLSFENQVNKCKIHTGILY